MYHPFVIVAYMQFANSRCIIVTINITIVAGETSVFGTAALAVDLSLCTVLTILINIVLARCALIDTIAADIVLT